mmetsp:Transcript_10412/g.18728  ORF Transcript_10412/g.18728 Transcript_10412/m.18728 type:complete len:511 (+) Transcript_10412:141-1673(+)
MALCKGSPVLSHPIVFSVNFGIFAVLAFYLELSLPFARSIVECVGPSRAGLQDAMQAGQLLARAEGADNSTENLFSGSAYCADRLHVIGEGQHFFSIMLLVKLLFRTAAGPFLGALADKFGRRPLLLFGLAGLEAAILLAVLAAAAGSGPTAVFLIVVSSAVQGVTSIFQALFLAVVADLTKGSEVDQPAFFVTLSMCQAVSGTVGFTAAVGLETLNLTNYLPVWCATSVLMVLFLAIVARHWPETLSTERKNGEDDCLHSALAAIKEAGPLLLDPFLQYVLLAAVLLCAGISVQTITASFTMGVYNWPQGALQLWLMAFGGIGLAAVALAERCISYFGAAHVLVAACALAVFDSCIRILAPLQEPWGSTFLLTSSMFDALLGPLFPAFNTILARRFDTTEQGKTHALIGGCVNVSTALSSPVYAWLFNPAATHFFPLALPYVLGCILVTGGAIVLSLAVWPTLDAENQPVLKYTDFDKADGAQNWATDADTVSAAVVGKTSAETDDLDC